MLGAKAESSTERRMELQMGNYSVSNNDFEPN